MRLISATPARACLPVALFLLLASVTLAQTPGQYAEITLTIVSGNAPASDAYFRLEATGLDGQPPFYSVVKTDAHGNAAVLLENGRWSVIAKQYAANGSILFASDPVTIDPAREKTATVLLIPSTNTAVSNAFNYLPFALVIAFLFILALALIAIRTRGTNAANAPANEPEPARPIPEKTRADQVQKIIPEPAEPFLPETLPVKPPAAPLAPTKKMRDVIATLSERERVVVEYLLGAGGKARQSKIIHACKIPKTSFFRIAKSLSKKNVIQQEKFLNTKELAFTDWFTKD